MSNKEPIYRVIFSQENKTYELYARYISEETLPAFLEVEQLLFREDKTLVDPTEEKLKSEFRDVCRTYIPIHAIFRVDEVFQEEPERINKDQPERKDECNVRQFPLKKPSTRDLNE